MITKKAKKEYVRHMLSTSELWQKHALLKIYEYQTDDEQAYGTTKHYNDVGFSGADAEILSSFAVQLKSKGFLSPKQMQIVAKKMKKTLIPRPRATTQRQRGESNLPVGKSKGMKRIGMITSNQNQVWSQRFSSRRNPAWAGAAVNWLM